MATKRACPAIAAHKEAWLNIDRRVYDACDACLNRVPCDLCDLCGAPDPRESGLCAKCERDEHGPGPKHTWRDEDEKEQPNEP